MIQNVECIRCRCPLEDMGALVFGPPTPGGSVSKFHLCRPCFGLLMDWMRT